MPFNTKYMFKEFTINIRLEAGEDFDELLTKIDHWRQCAVGGIDVQAGSKYNARDRKEPGLQPVNNLIELKKG